MSLEIETELSKRKKSPAKPKAKPIADRHAVVPREPDWSAFLPSADDATLSDLQAQIALELTGRRQRIREQLEAQAAAIGAKVTFPGKGRKGEAAPIKYRGPNGAAWAGRGVKPVWLREALERGHTLEEFAV